MSVHGPGLYPHPRAAMISGSWCSALMAFAERFGGEQLPVTKRLTLLRFSACTAEVRPSASEIWYPPPFRRPRRHWCITPLPPTDPGRQLAPQVTRRPPTVRSPGERDFGPYKRRRHHPDNGHNELPDLRHNPDWD
jgi:hypothetical protein